MKVARTAAAPVERKSQNGRPDPKNTAVYRSGAGVFSRTPKTPSSRAAKSVKGPKNLDEEKTREPSPVAVNTDLIPEKFVKEYEAKGDVGLRVLAMIRDSLQEGGARSVHMEVPSIEPEKPVDKRPKRLDVDRIDVVQLSFLFPLKGKNAPKACYRLDEISEVEIEPFDATVKEIEDLPLSDEERTRVKYLDLFRSAVTDEQLIALIEKFPSIEEVHLSLCVDLTNEGVDALARLKKLKSLHLLFCQKVKHDQLKELSLGDIEEFGLSTKGPIGVPFAQKLANSKKLRRVSFNLSPDFAPEALFCFKEAGVEEISARGCEQIDDAAVDELNAKRKDRPICVSIGEADRAISGLPPILRMPPEMRDGMQVISRRALSTFFPDTNPNALPHPSVIRDAEFNGADFKAIHLSGDVPSEIINESLVALIDRCPNCETIRIENSKLIGESAIIHLPALKHAKSLYLINLPGLTAKMIRVMLAETKWQELEEVFFSNVAVSDEALQRLSRLPKLRRITLLGSDQVTMQGFYHLMVGCQALEYLEVDAPAIDAFGIQEFEIFRPAVKLVVEERVDPSLNEMALIEMERRLFDPTAKNHYHFLPDLLRTDGPIPADAKMDLVPEEVDRFYEGLYKKFRIEKPKEKKGWLALDLFLQSYLDIKRVAWGYRKELLRVGFFTNVDPGKAPETVKEIIHLMRIRNWAQENPYVKKMQVLDLQNLGIYWIPAFLMDEFEFPQLVQIKLQDTNVAQVPEGFKMRCPQLEVIEHSSGVFEARAAFSDESLGRIDLDKVEQLSLFDSEYFTVQGLVLLAEKCPQLKAFSMTGCGIDPLAIQDFSLKRPEVKVVLNQDKGDETLNDLSLQEARKVMEDPAADRLFVYTDSKIDVQMAQKFYHEQLKKLGILYPFDLNQDMTKQLMHCDQILQAYANIWRTTNAIKKQLFLLGAFKGLDAELQVLQKTPLGMIELMHVRDGEGRVLSGRILALNLSNLGISYIPSVVLYGFDWNGLRIIDLRGTHVKRLPDTFISEKCPKLQTVHYSDRTVQMGEAIEAGPPKEPVKKPGRFANFWNWGKKPK